MAGPVHRPVRGPGDPGHCKEPGVAVRFCGGRNPREERQPAGCRASLTDGNPNCSHLSMLETQVQFLGREDPLEKGMVTHCNILAWRIPWTEELGGLQSRGLQKVGHDCLVVLSLFFDFLEDILLYVTFSLPLSSFFSSSFLTSFLSSFFLHLSLFSSLHLP